MTRDGLVQPPDDYLWSTKRRVQSLLIVGFFVFLLAGTALIDLFWPAPLPVLVGEEKHIDRGLRESAHLMDGSSARLIERDRRLKSRVRSTVAQDYTFFQYRWLREAKESVIVGPDHWLFIASRVKPFSDSAHRAKHTAACLTALERRLSEKDVKLLVVPIPRKAVIYSEYLPRGVDPEDDLDLQFLEDLRQRGVSYVDLLTPFLASTAETLFFRAGAHWTPRAEMIAAEIICREGGILQPERDRHTRICALPREPEDIDILRFIGLELTDTKTLRAKRFRSHFFDLTLSEYGVCRREDGIIYEERVAESPKLALVGTSFSALRNLPDFLAHFAAEPVLNLAQPGGNLGELLRQSAYLEDELELLIVELPMCKVLEDGARLLGGDLFGSMPGGDMTPIAPATSFEIFADPSGDITCKGERRKLAVLRSGMVTHSGDGAVSLHLMGNVSGGGVEIEIQSGTGGMTFMWQADRSEIMVPVWDTVPHPGSSHLFVHPPGQQVRSPFI